MVSGVGAQADASLGAADMELAIALFERGFPEARVQEALRHCGSLDEAIEWLTGAAVGGKAGSKALAGAVANAPTASRRRAVRKVCDTSNTVPGPSGPAATAAPASDVKVAAAPASVTESTSAGSTVASPAATAPSTTGGGEAASPAAASTTTRRTELEESPGTSGAIKLEVAIEPRDASSWWQEAAARFSQAAAAAAEASDVERSPAASLPTQTPKRKREASEAGDGADAEADAEVDGMSSGEPREAKKAPRPPATPCSSKAASEHEAGGQGPETPPGDEAVTGSASAQASSAEKAEEVCQACCSPEPSSKVHSTPRSSPRAMRLNSREEMCQICCDDVLPWRAVRLGCSHGWYCAQCMLRHAEARLSTGAASIACPECVTPLAERDLRKLLPQEIIDKLLARSLEQAVSSAADLWACPTPNCPMRVALEDGEIARLHCTFCRKTCCLRCGAQPYHKGLTCQEHAARVRAGNRAKRKQQEDEECLMRWMEETGTKQCPTCRIAVSKQNIKNQNTQYSECHKMCCRNCNTKFCFKCLAVLTDSYTCGCTIDAHGFIDPTTGKRLNHLRKGRGRPAAKHKSR